MLINAVSRSTVGPNGQIELPFWQALSSALWEGLHSPIWPAVGGEQPERVGGAWHQWVCIARDFEIDKHSRERRARRAESTAIAFGGLLEDRPAVNRTRQAT